MASPVGYVGCGMGHGGGSMPEGPPPGKNKSFTRKPKTNTKQHITTDFHNLGRFVGRKTLASTWTLLVGLSFFVVCIFLFAASFFLPVVENVLEIVVTSSNYLA